jgi:hypothetical protein
LENIRDSGLIDVFQQRGLRIKSQYDIKLNEAREGIDVIGFGLKSLREDYQKEFKAWSSRARVRILLLDPNFISPECSIANQRDREEGDDVDSINRDVRAFIRGCAHLLNDEMLKFDIRLYKCLPSINVFRIDDHLFWGPYLVGDVSRNFPTFLVDRQGSLFKRLLAHFETIWSSDEFSRPVPSDWIRLP